MRINLSKKITAFVLLLLLIAPSHARAEAYTIFLPVDKIPAINVVREDPQTLHTLACVDVQLQEGDRYVKVPSDKLTPVVPSNIQDYENTIFFCSQESLNKLSVIGKVSPAPIVIAGAIVGIYALGEVINYAIHGTTFTEQSVRTVGRVAGAGAIESVQNGGLIHDTIHQLAYYMSKLGVWLLHKFGFLIALTLTASRFITHPFVTMAWPFVQGIANLGFILALLLIAAATTLRLDIGGGVKRLLPRLLLAALFINFSLVIGGVLIDGSRLLMVILTNNLGGLDEIESLPVLVLGKSDIFGTVFNLQQEFNPKDPRAEGDLVITPKTSSAFQMLLAMVVIWGLVFAFFTMLVGFFIRYIMLIILLSFSPLAYLAFALPNAQNLAARWWQEFLKYVFYGPAALLILLFVTRIPDANIGGQLFGWQIAGVNASLLEGLAHTAIVIVILIAAATVGRYMGIAGSAAAVNFAKNKGLGAARWTGRTAAAPVRAGGRAVGNQVRDVKDVVKSSTRDALKNNKYTKWAVPAKRDDKGNLKDGETSYLKTQAEKLIGPQGKKKEQANAAKAVVSLPGGIRGNLDNAAISGLALRKSHVTDALGKPAVMDIVNNTSDDKQVAGVIDNNDFMRSLNDTEKNQFVQNIQTNTTIGALPAPPAGATPEQLAQYAIDNDRSMRKTKADLINRFTNRLNKLEGV